MNWDRQIHLTVALSCQSHLTTISAAVVISKYDGGVAREKHSAQPPILSPFARNELTCSWQSSSGLVVQGYAQGVAVSIDFVLRMVTVTIQTCVFASQWAAYARTKWAEPTLGI